MYSHIVVKAGFGTTVTHVELVDVECNAYNVSNRGSDVPDIEGVCWVLSREIGAGYSDCTSILMQRDSCVC